MAKTEKYYTGLALNFGQTIRNWAAQSAKQLKDAYAMQKVWDSTRRNAVWSGKNRRHLKKFGEPHSGYITIHDWYEENLWRMQQARNGVRSHNTDKPLKFWYSTGESYRISQTNPVTVIDDSLASGTVDFHTTMGALYMEAGVGATGKGYVRGKRSSKGRKRIKVDREKPYTHKQRYVGEWKPMAGKTHRPNTRQQVNLLARRLKWAAQTVYHHELSIYIAYELERTFMELGNTIWTTDKNGMPVGTYVEGHKNLGRRMTWEEYLAQRRGYDVTK